MECIVITGASASALQTAINDWINSAEFDITIKNVAMSEGSVGVSALKALIFYERANRSARS